MSIQLQLSAWKKIFLSNKDFDASNKHFDKIKKASLHSTPFSKSFELISKNNGVSFLFLDPSEKYMQLFHHGHVLGGNWSSPEKKLIAVLGFDKDAKPVQIVSKSVKNIKEKSFSRDELWDAQADEDAFKKLADPTEDFHFKNILPIPNILTQAFIQLNSTSPFEVAKAFIEKVTKKDSETSIQDTSLVTDDIEEIDGDNSSDPKADQADPMLDSEKNDSMAHESREDVSEITPDDILHVVQFCHLCALQKIPPVLYSFSPDVEINEWFNSLPVTRVRDQGINKRPISFKEDEKDADSEVSSPENKISKKDHYLINTMIKLHDSMDKSSKMKEEKEPGFKRLESHRKQLILNASAVPPFSSAAKAPTEFYQAFLSKKSQFKAKDMLLHRFHLDKVAFNPNSSFITNLWNCEFFWIIPDSPSGISIFFCPETKSSNSYELEKERNLALADKVNASDIEKLAKQKMYIPT